MELQKACCGFGHREVYQNITGQLERAVLEAAEHGCTLFYTGAMVGVRCFTPEQWVNLIISFRRLFAKQRKAIRISSSFASSRI